MNPRAVLNFFTTTTGKLLLFMGMLGLILFLYSNNKNQLAKPKKAVKTDEDVVIKNSNFSEFVVAEKPMGEVVQGDTAADARKKEEQQRKLKEEKEDAEKVVAAKKVLAAQEAAVKREEVALQVRHQGSGQSQREQPKRMLPMSLGVQLDQLEEHIEPELSDTYAPFGRFIKCQLVNTVDSSSLATPIVGLVLQDVVHDGKVVISAGTEIHGTASGVTQRDRLATEGNWTFVWRTLNGNNGKEMAVSGVALDWAHDVRTGRYGITDGSAGLRGKVIETDEYAKLKLYSALAISGASTNVTDYMLKSVEAKTQQGDTNNIFNGPGRPTTSTSQAQTPQEVENRNQLKIGLAGAAKSVTDRYAADVLDQLTRNGSFVRVAAGTCFQVYVTQTIDAKEAAPGAVGGRSVRLAASRLANEERGNSLERATTLALSKSSENQTKVVDAIARQIERERADGINAGQLSNPPENEEAKPGVER